MDNNVHVHEIIIRYCVSRRSDLHKRDLNLNELLADEHKLTSDLRLCDGIHFHTKTVVGRTVKFNFTEENHVQGHAIK